MTDDSTPQPDLAFFVGLERRVWDALVAGDPDADAACLSEGFLGVYPSGFAGRADHRAQLEDGPTVTEYEIVGARTLVVAPGHVVVAYLARYRRPTGAAFEQMYVSSLWSSVDGRWQNVFSQDTPIGGDDAVV